MLRREGMETLLLEEEGSRQRLLLSHFLIVTVSTPDVDRKSRFFQIALGVPVFGPSTVVTVWFFSQSASSPSVDLVAFMASAMLCSEA